MHKKNAPIAIVWFKRDIRLQDHKPIYKASQCGLPVLLLYCFEPSVMNYTDSDTRHWRFVYQSLQDLNKQLRLNNTSILICHDEAKTVFDKINSHYTIQKVFSHAETGNKLTFQRDIEMKKFFQHHNIEWREYQTNGVVRKLKSRSTWNKRWNDFMLQPAITTNISTINFLQITDTLKQSFKNPLPQEIIQPNKNFQEGGETFALKYLHSFLKNRYNTYSLHISKPENSRKSCSRLSPYLAWGNISMRMVYQQTLNRYKTAERRSPLSNFVSRLHWHCHFIQKFEDECRIEFENINRGYNSLEKPVNEKLIKAWETGKTGIPLIDACMRCVVTTGYLNFRMRAMVVSFFTHHLWQDWRHCAHFLARQFLDFEPGIHYAQLQMQAGVTGINTVRIYNPVKNSKEHDEEGLFIKKWLPELALVPPSLAHEPWKLSLIEQILYKIELGKDYPLPVIDIDTTRKKASDAIWAIQKTETVKIETQRILKKHTFRITDVD